MHPSSKALIQHKKREIQKIIDANAESALNDANTLSQGDPNNKLAALNLYYEVGNNDAVNIKLRSTAHYEFALLGYNLLHLPVAPNSGFSQESIETSRWQSIHTAIEAAIWCGHPDAQSLKKELIEKKNVGHVQTTGTSALMDAFTNPNPFRR